MWGFLYSSRSQMESKMRAKEEVIRREHRSKHGQEGQPELEEHFPAPHSQQLEWVRHLVQNSIQKRKKGTAPHPFGSRILYWLPLWSLFLSLPEVTPGSDFHNG